MYIMLHIPHCCFLLLSFAISCLSADILPHEISNLSGASCDFNEATFCNYLNYGWGFTISARKLSHDVAKDRMHPPAPSALPSSGRQATIASPNYYPCVSDSVGVARLSLSVVRVNISAVRPCLILSYTFDDNGSALVKFRGRTWRLLGDSVNGGWYYAQIPLWQSSGSTAETEQLIIEGRFGACIDNVQVLLHPLTNTSKQAFTQSACHLRWRPLSMKMISQSGGGAEEDASVQSVRGLISHAYFYSLTTMRQVLQPYLLPMGIVIGVLLMILPVMSIAIACSTPRTGLLSCQMKEEKEEESIPTPMNETSCQLPVIVQCRPVSVSNRLQNVRSIVVTDDFNVSWDEPVAASTLPVRASAQFVHLPLPAPMHRTGGGNDEDDFMPLTDLDDSN